MNLYNSLTNKKENFQPHHPPKVEIYICGPTVYDYTHLGHLRTYTNSDIFIRALNFFGYHPYTVMNITDVGHLTDDADMGEDKMEKKAREEQKDIWQIAEEYTIYFWKSMRQINVRQPDVAPKATDHIQEMIELVKRLEEKGYTYRISDGIYYDTAKFSDYGKLANVELEQLEEGARVEKNPGKKNPTDFALWKFSPENGPQRQMEWDSPWGTGFPGWHIECSAMSMKYLGEQFDVHLGGIDHINVHHTNEIAQSEAATGEKPWVKYWMHNDHLLIEGRKMSKSLHNFYKLEDIKEKGYHPLALRYLFLNSHYRSRMNFTWDALDSAQKALKNLYQIVTEAKENPRRTDLSNDKLQKIEQYKREFEQALKDDLMMPEAMAVVWKAAKSNLPAPDKRDLLLFFDEVLGLDLDKPQLNIKQYQLEEIPDQKVKELAEQRKEMRVEEKWEQADEIRDQIKGLGWEVKDTPKGQLLQKE
jgi:cysteinyl-tRNA synthetase